MKIKRALISVSDKMGLGTFAEILQRHGVEIISTGGTAKFLEQNGIRVTPLSEVTGFPEILDGRVKTLHPTVFGGILAVRSNPKHQEQLESHHLQPIDLVVVNLYPFEEQAVARNLDIADSIEWIDIGGPSLIRAAAKNHEFVTVLTDPQDYSLIAEELEKNNGSISPETRLRMAIKAFHFTAHYDSTIANYFSSRSGDAEFPQYFPVSLRLSSTLRYGENPHQKGALYVSGTQTGAAIATAEKLQGKELSFNNLLDFDAAFQLSCTLDQSCAVIIKHNNPCGVALDSDVAEAYRKARTADPVAAFGGVVGINGVVDQQLAKIITEAFIEGIVTKDYTSEALQILSAKTGMRLLRIASEWKIRDRFDLKKISGGMLIQDRDEHSLKRSQTKIASKRVPTDQEWKAMEFAWVVSQYVKSNAIVFAHADVTVGVGAGQMSRVDSVKIARLKAQSSLKGTVVASDAFFPFRDGVDEIAAAGATAIIQPGGSIRDKEVIEAADEHGLAMIFTSVRHFRH